MKSASHSFQFDVSQVPFSRRGSRFAFGRLPEKRAKELGKKPGLFLRTVAGGVGMERREIFRVQALSKDRPVAVTEIATPEKLSLVKSPGESAEAAFASDTRLLLRGQGLGLRLSGDGGWYTTLRPAGDGVWELNLFAQRLQVMLTLRSGHIGIDAPWDKEACKHVRIDLLPDENGNWELEIEEFRTAWEPPAHTISFADAVASARGDFKEWFEHSLPASHSFAPARPLAAYVNWTSLVTPRGHFKREAMLMSKNWMINVWSWDHCFNAIALAKLQPTLAWDQWALMFDHQNEHGALPDCVNDADIVWNFTKPPVHGWALREMRAQGIALTKRQLEQARGWLSAWTRWWLRYRDDDHDGLPNYNHGNDSGWDNASFMSAGPPVEGADLAAFLIVQMDVIAGLCDELKKPKEARQWRSNADDLFQRLMSHSWRGNHFVSPRSGDHLVAEGDSLVPFMPMLLGNRFDAPQRASLIRGVKRFVTAHGVATECPQSPLYQPDGYWRGPVWAPSTHLIVSGLLECGEEKLASRIARAFCKTCVKSGMAENFDALTGAGLRDRAYTWTASVFQVLAARF
jgi:glycogen debranching enzyme